MALLGPWRLSPGSSLSEAVGPSCARASPALTPASVALLPTRAARRRDFLCGGSGPTGARARGQRPSRWEGCCKSDGRILKPPQPLWPAQVGWPSTTGRQAGRPRAGFVSRSPRHRRPSECAPWRGRAAQCEKPAGARPPPTPPAPPRQAKRVPAAGCSLCSERNGGRGHCAPPPPGAHPASAFLEQWGNWGIINLWPKFQL